MIITGDDSRWKAIVLLGQTAKRLLRLRPRVSLFGLLLLMTTVACWAAYAGSETHRERRLRVWYAEVEKRGGSVNAMAPGMVGIHFQGIPLSGDDFSRLQEMRADRCFLHFSSGDLNDERLLSLASVGGLEDLSFAAADVSLSAVQEFERRAPGCAVHTLRAALR